MIPDPPSPPGADEKGAKRVSTRSRARIAGGASAAGDKRKLQELFAELSQVDLLTELPTRGQFLDRLDGGMARATRSSTLLGVMLLNVDRFKLVNRTHGYQAADTVLKEMAGRLYRTTRKSDTIGRFGGDEFAVMLEGLEQREGAIIAANRALTVVSAEPYLVDGVEIRVTATIGLSFFPADAPDTDALLQHADVAMCYAKEHAPKTAQLYSPEFDSRSRHDEERRVNIERKLASLTPREREVLGILVEGKANKLIGYLLGASTRTIENHRASIMKKMAADSLPDLVRMVLSAGSALGADARASSNPPR